MSRLIVFSLWLVVFAAAIENTKGSTNRDESKNNLYSSRILGGNLEYLEKLSEWLNGKMNWKLCWRASQDGWASKVFHTKCDDKVPTVTIVQVGNYIFGGYSKLSWAVAGKPGYRRCPECFIFSLKNKDNLEPFKASPRSPYTARPPVGEIFVATILGPAFGLHGFVIIDDANLVPGSYNDFGYIYQPPPGYDYPSAKIGALLAGTSYFIPTEVEVYYLV